MTGIIPVPVAFLESLWEKIACASLNMYDPTQSSAEIFQWRGKAWISTGGQSYQQTPEKVEIREVVPDALWDHPYNDTNKSGPDFYLGGRFHPKGNRSETWVMTGNEINLAPEKTPSITPVQQLTFFAQELNQ
jgi:hypothetical protein